MSNPAQDADVACLCCGSRAGHTPLVKVRNYTYLHCTECDSAFLSDIDEEDQKAVHTDRDYKLMRVLLESRSYQFGHEKWLVDEMKKLKPSGTVLEVGCGSGFFLKCALDAGYEVLGMDLGGENVSFADQFLGVEIRNQDFLTASGKFDWVVMHQLIEHVPIPGAFLATTRELLKPEGIVMITTPNLRFAKLAVRIPRAVGLRPRLGDAFGHPPSHCVIFSPASLEGLMNRQGLEVVHLGNNPSGMKTLSSIRRFLEKRLLAKLPQAIGPNMLICARPIPAHSEESSP